MGKIVKYCGSCDEGFGERFTFCPVCGGPLQAFEMNPVAGKTEEAQPTPEVIAEPPVENIATPVEEPVVPDTIQMHVEEPVEPEPHNEIEVDHEYDDAKYDYLNVDEAPVYSYAASTPIDDGYHITVIEEQNGKQRNSLLLGISVFMIVFVAGATLYSLFSKALDVDAIGDTTSLAMLLDEVPMPVDEVKQKKDKDQGGGGGGGGREEKDPVNQGDLADQTKNPIRPPDAHVPRLDNPELVLPPPSTQGNMKFPKVYNQWGDPNSRFGNLSNGPGTGGGMGTGNGLGQGSGNGTGTGSGNGSGYGGGNGNGNGNGSGNGSGGPPPPDRMTVSSPVKILAKPKPGYTEAGRANNVQGTVRLKVTLLASGQVGGVSAISTLPYGLTEQAIAAAKQIRFEPKKVNGTPVSTTVTIEYSFNIY